MILKNEHLEGYPIRKNKKQKILLDRPTIFYGPLASGKSLLAHTFTTNVLHYTSLLNDENELQKYKFVDEKYDIIFIDECPPGFDYHAALKILFRLKGKGEAFKPKIHFITQVITQYHSEFDYIVFRRHHITNSIKNQYQFMIEQLQEKVEFVVKTTRHISLDIDLNTKTIYAFIYFTPKE